MIPQMINRTDGRIPRAFVAQWIQWLSRELAGRSHVKNPPVLNLKQSELGVIFVSATEIKKLNRMYRQKNYATDVLSFAGDGRHLLGELILSLEVLRRQAKANGWSLKHELGYMLVHGVLHLLGYDHERGGRLAREMFSLQDDVFERLCEKLEAVRVGNRRKKRGRS